MKIALVSPYDYRVPGGVGKHIASLSRQFHRMGHDVRIIAPGSGDDVLEDHQGVYHIGRVTPVPGNGSVARITLGVPFRSRLARRVRQILDAERFDVIHVHEPLMPSLPLAVLMAGGASAVKVGTFHAYRESYYGYYYGRPLLRGMVKRLDGRIAVSRAAYEFVSRYFPGAYSIIPNGVDLDTFRADVPPIERYMDGRPTVLFVGRIEKRKGLSYLIRAYAELREWIPDVRVLVVGRQGRAGGGYIRYVREHDLSGIEFVGEVSAADLPRYYRSCDVFCSPAVKGESFGMVLLEAMALGKPVVATAIDGYQTVMEDGVQGRLVAPRDSTGLARALLEVLESPELRRRYGDQGRVTARSYSWERVAARLLRFYDDVRSGSTSSEWHLPLAVHPSEPDDRLAPLALPEGAPSLQGQLGRSVPTTESAPALSVRTGVATAASRRVPRPAIVLPAGLARRHGGGGRGEAPTVGDEASETPARSGRGRAHPANRPVSRRRRGTQQA